MDCSSRSILEVVQQLRVSFSDLDELRNLLKIVIRGFENEEDSQIIREIISLLFGSTIKALPLDELDDVLLEPFLPLIKSFLSKKLKANHKIIEDASIFEDDAFALEILNNLEVCVQVLTCLDDLLTYVVNMNRIPVTKLRSCPKNIADMVYVVFSHCQKSKTEYKDVFPSVRNELMSLFKQCHKVQGKLFIMLNEKLIFNCTFEDELQLLVNVLEILNSMSDIVAELDTKSLVDHWKGFAQLAQTYAAHLCSRLDVARPITCLAANIAYQLNNLKAYINAEKEVILRTLKISSLQLKVLIKLCEQYKGYLGDCQTPLLNCLISLSARTSQFLSQDGMTPDVATQVVTQLSAGAAPLLSHLLADPLFFKEYFQYADELQLRTLIEKFGYCNLTTLILKKLVKLIPADEEMKDIWLKPTLPLIETTFKILRHCEDVFYAYEEDTYQTLLTHAVAFVVVTCTSDMFPLLEKLLFRQLLQPFLWPAVFSSDTLCLVARFGSSQLCQQLVNLLSEMCRDWPVWDRSRPEWSFVSWTLSRLTNFLAVNDLNTFVSSLPCLNTIASDLTTLLGKPASDDSILLYISLMDRLTILEDHLELFPDAKSALAEPVYEMWQYMTLPVDFGCPETSHWFCKLFSVLVTMTSHIVDSFTNVRIVNVLQVLEEMNSSTPTIFQCGSCEFLRSLASKTLDDDSSQTSVCNKISSLFVQLMKSKNPITKQIALETFSFFAYVTKYEQIVANTLANDRQLQNEITDYLKCVPIVNSSTDLVKHIGNRNHNFLHKCKPKSESCNVNEIKLGDPEPNPCKKLKTSLTEESVSAALQRIEKDLSLIEEFKSSAGLTQSQTSDLACILKRIDTIVKTS